MLKSLELNNWKRHEHLKVNFTEGLNGISGPNWAGKSSILYAILFCLGGASVVPGSKLMTKGTNTGFRQTLVFEVKGVEYTVTRTKTGAKLRSGDELLADGTTDVNLEVEKLLGISMRRFKQLRYAEQKKTSSILTVGATELHKIIEDITGVDELNIILQELAADAAKHTGALSVLEVPEGSIEEASKTLKDAEGRLNLLLLDSQKVSEDLSKAEASLTKVDALAREYRLKATSGRHLQERRDPLLAKVSSLTAELETIRDEIAALYPVNEMAATADKVRELAAKRLAAQQMKEAIKVSGSALERAKEGLLRAEGVMKASRLDTALLPPHPDGAIQVLVDEVHGLELVESQLIRDRSVLAKSLKDSICSKCERPFEGTDREKAEAQLQAVETQLPVVEGSIQVKREEIKSLRQDLKRITSARQEEEEAKTALREAESRVRESQQAYSDTVSEVDEWTDSDEQEWTTVSGTLKLMQGSEQRERELTSLLAGCSTRLDEARREEVEVRDQLKALGTIPTMEQVRDLESAKAVESNSVDDLRRAARAKNREVEEAKGSLVAVKNSLQSLKTSQAKAAEYATALTLTKQLTKYLKDNRDRYMKEAWESFMSNASTFTSAVTGGDISEVLRLPNGQFGFKEGDNEEMTLKEASGAQESIMGLGVQQAMAMVAHCGLDLVLMDEPTADMTDEVSMASLNMLASEGRQIVMVSHNRLDTSCFTNLVEL